MFNSSASKENNPATNSTPVSSSTPAPTIQEPTTQVTPSSQPSSHKLLLIVGGIALLIGIGIFLYLMNIPSSTPAPSPTPVPTNQEPVTETETGPEGVVCTMEAKICPDGSSVGRSGPKCEFAACPGESVDNPLQWQKQSVTFPTNNITVTLNVPNNYKFFINYAEPMIQQQYPEGIIVTSDDPPTDLLYFNDLLLGKYDNTSVKDFYEKYLNGEIEGLNQGAKSLITSTEDHILENGSYTIFYVNSGESNSKTVHYVMLKNDEIIALENSVRDTSILQKNIETILNSVEITK